MNFKSSIFAIIAACGMLADGAAYSAVRISNSSGGGRSYADAYNQVATMQYNAQVGTGTNLSTEESAALPVRVANVTTARAVLRGDDSAGVNYEMLESCANIYPGGEFAWDKSNAGLGLVSGDTCVAVVEMRAVYGNNDIVLARAQVPAGSSIDCNISRFPESGYTIDAGNVVFPADTEPSIDDVRRVMDKEQKENAALKIVAATIVGGVVGNMAGRNDSTGNGGLMGTDSGKLRGATVGALSSAAVMTAATQSGKVAGDVIMSAGVNAAAGGMIGNMMASGQSKLLVNDCTMPGEEKSIKCVWGVVEEKESLDTGKAYFNIDTGAVVFCPGAANKPCNEQRLIGFTFGSSGNAPADYYSSLETARAENFQKIRDKGDDILSCYDEAAKEIKSSDCTNKSWVEIYNAGRPGKITTAAVEWQDGNKMTGYTADDWVKWKNGDGQSATVYYRSSMGKLSDNANIADKINDFYPIYEDSEDGGIIDVGNRARTGATMKGAGIGAGLGGFAAYQGAQDEIDRRWVSAVQEYRDSLQKIYCATGTRFLSQYNDVAYIPEVK